jgi:hypothetical protein
MDAPQGSGRYWTKEKWCLLAGFTAMALAFLFVAPVLSAYRGIKGLFLRGDKKTR